MAKGESLPDGTHVLRGCSRGYDKEEVTFTAFAMRHREVRELAISVGWVECPHVDIEAQNLDGAENRLGSLAVKPPYAILSSVDIRKISRGDFALDVLEDGNTHNPCHCRIASFSNTPLDLELQKDLAEIANKSPVLGTLE